MGWARNERILNLIRLYPTASAVTRDQVNPTTWTWRLLKRCLWNIEMLMQRTFNITRFIASNYRVLLMQDSNSPLVVLGLPFTCFLGHIDNVRLLSIQAKRCSCTVDQSRHLALWGLPRLSLKQDRSEAEQDLRPGFDGDNMAGIYWWYWAPEFSSAPWTRKVYKAWRAAVTCRTMVLICTDILQLLTAPVSVVLLTTIKNATNVFRFSIITSSSCSRALLMPLIARPQAFSQPWPSNLKLSGWAKGRMWTSHFEWEVFQLQHGV